MSRVVASPIPITSQPIRARLDAVKAAMSEDMQSRFGRDATWNEVAERLLNRNDQVEQQLAEARKLGLIGPAAAHAHALTSLGESSRDQNNR